MTPTITCPKCNRSYAFKASLSGKRVKCKCGERLEFPSHPDASPAPSRQSSSPQPTASRPVNVPPPAHPGLESDDDLFASTTSVAAAPPNPYAQQLAVVPPPVASSPSDSATTTFLCGNCNATLPVGSVVCTVCGYNQKTRQQMVTRVAAAPKPLNYASQPVPASHSGAGGGGSGVRNMAIGAGLVILGLAITIGTYMAASEGGSYYLFYGPVIWGGIQFFKGLAQVISGD